MGFTAARWREIQVIGHLANNVVMGVCSLQPCSSLVLCGNVVLWGCCGVGVGIQKELRKVKAAAEKFNSEHRYQLETHFTRRKIKTSSPVKSDSHHKSTPINWSVAPCSCT